MGSDVTVQINIIINTIICNFFFFIFCLESFAGNDCHMSGTHRHHQRLAFILCDALLQLQLLFFLPLVLSSASEMHAQLG